jgi:hypothetical protein
MFGESSSEYKDPYESKYKDIDNENEEEDDGIDADDRVSDISNAVEEAGGKLTEGQSDAFIEALDTISTHYDENPKVAKKLFNKLEKLLKKITSAVTEERIDKQDEYDLELTQINKKAIDLDKLDDDIDEDNI